jgi:hypothetical protein
MTADIPTLEPRIKADLPNSILKRPEAEGDSACEREFLVFIETRQPA